MKNILIFSTLILSILSTYALPLEPQGQGFTAGGKKLNHKLLEARGTRITARAETDAGGGFSPSDSTPHSQIPNPSSGSQSPGGSQHPSPQPGGSQRRISSLVWRGKFLKVDPNIGGRQPLPFVEKGKPKVLFDPGDPYRQDSFSSSGSQTLGDSQYFTSPTDSAGRGPPLVVEPDSYDRHPLPSSGEGKPRGYSPPRSQASTLQPSLQPPPNPSTSKLKDNIGPSPEAIEPDSNRLQGWVKAQQKIADARLAVADPRPGLPEDGSSEKQTTGVPMGPTTEPSGAPAAAGAGRKGRRRRPTK